MKIVTMLVFVIPLKARRYSNDWSETCFLLQRTLQSLEAQSVGGHQALVICNDEPEIADCSPRTIVLPTDVGADERGGGLTRGPLDLVRKRYFGLMQAREMGARHVMFLDADDLLHCDLVRTVEEGDDRAAYIINRGYRYDIGRYSLRRSYFFNEICASYAVVPRVMLRDLPNYSPWAHENFELTHTAHVKDASRHFRRHGLLCRRVPFFAGIYVRGHSQSMRDTEALDAAGGEILKVRQFQWSKRRLANYSKKAVGWMAGSQRINESLMSQFGGLAEHVARNRIDEL